MNHRGSFVELQVAADGRRESGLAQPILVRPIADRFELVVGERRTRAAKLLDWESIPAVVKELSDVDAALLLLVEDQQRQDANPMERAHGYRPLKEKFALPQEEIAKRLGVGQSTKAADKSWSVKETERRVRSALKSPAPKAEDSLAKLDQRAAQNRRRSAAGVRSRPARAGGV